MSWIKENSITFFQLFCIKVLKIGRIPRHLALIMDGNRRYAKKLNVDRTTGHHKGFDKLSEALKWCLELGISELTVYAFSIENFKRSGDEVDALMALANEKFKNFLDDMSYKTIIYENDFSDQINSLGIRLNVVGRLSLLPEHLRVLISKGMLITRNNNKLRLNIAYAYTGCDEISRAASYIVDSVNNNELSLNEINEDLISETLDLGEPEFLIRTSGEVRLSDFMLWQVSKTVLYFTDVFWPELSIWNLLAAIIYFRKHAPPISKENGKSAAQEKFLNNLEKRKWQEMENIVTS